MKLTFLGTGAAWRLPELNCDCRICREMRRRGETRHRTALLFSRETRLLVDCGPDIAAQLDAARVSGIEGVLITHEHGDHYMGLDELFVYKRNVPPENFHPIPVFLTAQSWEVVAPRFSYLVDLGVIQIRTVTPGQWVRHREFEIFPFKTHHGNFAKGSVGYVVAWQDPSGTRKRVVYTSDFSDIPGLSSEIVGPDVLVIQSFWLNEPVQNRPHHMSFQRALEFIRRIAPQRETFLVHMGDADKVPGDPANGVTKKYDPKSPLMPPGGSEPYPIPTHQAQWQSVVDRILSDRGLSNQVTVARDELEVDL